MQIVFFLIKIYLKLVGYEMVAFVMKILEFVCFSIGCDDGTLCLDKS